MQSSTHARIFIVKVASRCNLACTYCYMYQHVDQSWRRQPHFMSARTVRQLAIRLDEHAKQFDLGSVLVVAHGGEPLLNPALDEFFEEIACSVRSCKVEFAIQTNAVLLDAANAATLDKHAVHVGVSLDGSRDAHNRTRVTHSGEGSYDAVMHGITIARQMIPHLFDSILQVIDTDVPPRTVLETLEACGAPRADLLFPDLNYDTLLQSGLVRGQIGAWLCDVFDEWVERPTGIHIRIFMTIIALLLGRKVGTDQFGAASTGAVMVETDGAYHVYDALRTAFDGAGATGLTLFDSPIAAVEELPLAKAFSDKASAASPECLGCSLFSVCGGGSPLHRYSSLTRSFDQPSVYCDDLKLLIGHIDDYVHRVRPNCETVIRKPQAIAMAG